MSCKNHENVAIVLFGLIIVSAPLVRTNLTVPLVYLTSVISENQFKVQDQHIHSALMIAVEEINKRHVLQNVTLVAVPKKIEVKEDVTLVIDKVMESNAGAVLIGGNICEDIVTASKTWNKFSISYVRAYLMSIAHRIIIQNTILTFCPFQDCRNEEISNTKKFHSFLRMNPSNIQVRIIV